MKIGILAYHSACNYGANLQVLSTVGYLQRKGHVPRVLNFEPLDLMEYYNKKVPHDTYDMYRKFREKTMPLSKHCTSVEELAQIIDDERIEGIIIGSDAVAQHHTLLERITFPSSRFITVYKMTSDRLFPNPFWGTFSDFLKYSVPMAIMSSSSQDSEFRLFTPNLRKKMEKYLSRFVYISARDEWTKKMYKCISNGRLNVDITPDPVFSFNQNMLAMVPSKDSILRKFHLPEKYYLLSFLNNRTVSAEWILSFERMASLNGIACAALPLPQGICFTNNLAYTIATPLDPIDWYALIKYSVGYIGHNMHPIVVALHNAIPFFSFDNYGVSKYKGLYTNDCSSKIYHILQNAGFLNNRVSCLKYGYQPPAASDVITALLEFNHDKALNFAREYQLKYESMMNEILYSLNNVNVAYCFCENEPQLK